MDLILAIIVILIPLIAQIGVSSNYQKYKRVKNTKELTGYDVARKILDENGLGDIYIVETKGELTDHYDPTKRVVRLSSDIYHGKTVAAMSVAAHECGHAIQDKEGYTFMRIRSAIFPIVNVATSISYWIILLGFLFELLDLIYIGIALTCLGLLFQIVTLPVEFDASKRAGMFLKAYKLATEDESKGVKKMLGAAAMTYVAGVLASAIQILRLILVARNND